MILTCQKCSTSFRLEDALLKATGSKVRCSLCQNIWVAFPPETAHEAFPDFGHGDMAPASAAAGPFQDAADEGQALADKTPELKFFADGDMDGEPFDDDDAPLVADDINLDELDKLLSEEGDPPSAGPAPEQDFKTEELDLADLEKMLDLEADPETSQEAIQSAGSDDFDLDDVMADEAHASALETEDSVVEELDLDLEDLETLLEEDTGLGDEIAAVEESNGGRYEAGESPEADAAMDEMSLDLASGLEDLLEDDEEMPVVNEKAASAALKTTDSSPESSHPVAMENDEDQDLTFELAPELDGIFDEDEDQDVSLEETEELDFSELSAGLAAADEAPEAEEESDRFALDTEDFEDQLGEVGDLDDLELAAEEVAESAAPAEQGDLPELDLSGLDDSLGGDSAGLEGAEGDGEAPEFELDFDEGEGQGEDVEDFDLVLKEETDLSSGQPADPDETRELNIEELEFLLENAGDGAAKGEADASEGLELDFDLDRLDDGSDDDMEDATRELDLNDIEKMLEMDGADAKPPLKKEAVSEDLDLDLDMESVPSVASDSEDWGEETTGSPDALDLSELEKMLDVEDTTDAPATADDDLDDLDLDFDLQPSSDENDELDLEFDMLDEEPGEASALFDTSESEDLGLDIEESESHDSASDVAGSIDFEIMDGGMGVEEVDLDLDAEEIGAETLSGPTASGFSGKASPGAGNRDLTQELMDEMAAADTQTMAAPPIESKPIKPAPQPIRRKKKSSKGLVLLLLLVLLGGAVYLVPKYTNLKLPAITLPDLSGIPFIGDFFAQPAPEAIVPVEASLKGDWVQNLQAGRLYTIQGRVKNDYTSPRSYIRVTGRVYANGRQFERAATAYGGNILTPEELAAWSLDDIQKALSNRSGSDNRNVNVAPGQEVPFLVVFGDLPPDVELQEFAVEISGSLPVAGN